MTFLEAPAAVRSADDLLPHARAIIDDDIEALAQSPGVDISCRSGCGACCNQAVPVTPAEVRSILTEVSGMPGAQRADVRRRVRSAAEKLETAGFSATALSDATDPAERRAVSQRYFDAGIPCPLLDDGRCTIRAVRPLVCREYVVTSDPSHCATLDGEQIVRIRPRRNVVGGFGDVSASFGEPDTLVLALALAEAAPPTPNTEPKSGPAALDLMTSKRLPAPAP